MSLVIMQLLKSQRAPKIRVYYSKKVLKTKDMYDCEQGT